MATNKESTYYVSEWCKLAEIDYFSAFVKAYIPFNAWMNDHYKKEDTDRAKLEQVKRVHNTFRDKIIELLQLNDQEGEAFRNSIGELHDALQHSTVSKNGEMIRFDVVPRVAKTQPTVTNKRSGVTYSAQYCDNPKCATITVDNKSGTRKVKMSFKTYPADDDIKRHTDFGKLSQTQQDELLAVVHQVNPNICMSLLYSGTDKKKGIVCGAFRMIEELEQLAAGIIEILYSLRNGLFHGIVDPNKEANRVYGAAYQVLHKLIAALV